MKHFAFAILVLSMFASAISAQTRSDAVYFANLDYIFRQSEIGKEFVRKQEQSLAELESIEQQRSAELSQEEDRLTDLRNDMDVTEFEPLAEEFNNRVEEGRQSIETLNEQYSQNSESQRARILEFIRSEILALSKDLNDATILDARSALVLGPNSEISENVINRLNSNYQQHKAAIDEWIFAPYDGKSQISNETGIKNQN